MTIKDLLANTISYDNVDKYLNEQINQEISKELFYAIFSVLTRMEVRVLEMYYGLNGYEPQTLKAIGKEFWHSPSVIGRHKQKAFKVLQQPEVLKLLKQICQGEDVNIEKKIEKIVIKFNLERVRNLWNRELSRKICYIKNEKKRKGFYLTYFND